MINKLFDVFLDVVDEPFLDLGENWEAFEIFTICICLLPWLVLIIYLLFFKRYKIRYYVGEKEVYVQKYKPKEITLPFEYNNNKVWYEDIDCEKKFEFGTTLEKNIKLYKKIETEE